MFLGSVLSQEPIMTKQTPALALLLSCACLSACLDAGELDPPVDKPIDEPIDEPVGEPRPKQIMLNQMDLEPILLNSLIGTPEALGLLTSQPLRSDYFDVANAYGVLGQQLLDSYAQRFMDYLVRCALSPEDEPVVWDHPSDTPAMEWRGRLGLCSEWATQAPSSECLELVSACLLASENALGKSVMISQRGLDLGDKALTLADPVPVKTLDDEGVKIASFESCAVETGGADRDCGWSADESFVGACVPNSDVTLQCGSRASHGVIRVCEGHTACDHGSATEIVAREDMCDVYQQVALTCPASGSYAVMVGPSSSGGAPVSLVLNASAGEFPGSELTVFERREGAFFGTLFKENALYPHVSARVDTAGVVHRDVLPSAIPLLLNESMYACHDESFAASDGYALHRLCALVKDPDGDQATLCAADSLGPCHDVAAGLVCADDDTPTLPGDGDFDDCTDGATVWNNPITVFLDHPCDLLQGFWCDD
jgi:hypothetical protein